jgi:hypothetical protein
MKIQRVSIPGMRGRVREVFLLMPWKVVILGETR